MAEKRSTETGTEQAEGQRGLERSRGWALPTRREPFEMLGFGPWGLMRRMQDDIDRLFGTVGFGRGWPALFGEAERAEWAPAIEAFQRGNEFVVRADVPGLSRENLSVEIGEDALTIRGERKQDYEEEREGVYRSERAYGSFCRVIPLPEGAVADSAKATFKDGVLEVTLQAPSKEVRRGRRIEIAQATPEKAQQQR